MTDHDDNDDRGREHELSHETPGQRAHRTVTRDHLIEAARLLGEAEREVLAAELNAERGGQSAVGADAAIVRRAVHSERVALDATISRLTRRLRD